MLTFGGARDARLLLLTRSMRGFGAGALSIVLALDLAVVGYSDLVIGVLLGLVLAAASAWSLAVPSLERRWGRRAVFLAGATAFSAGGALLWADLGNPWAVLLAVALGGLVAGASDVGPLGALEQAVLADAAPEARRTEWFAVYNLLGYVGGALGALAAGPLSAAPGGLPGLPGGPHDVPALLYALLGLGLVPAYVGLSRPSAVAPTGAATARLDPGVRQRIYALASLFAVDAFGGGLIVNSLVVYYFAVRFSPGIDALGAVFFVANLAAGLSFLLAVPLARRFGLLRTMVFTHIPSNLLLICVAFGPSFVVASGLWIARACLSQMDVPTRQSYTQAIVPRAARPAAAGYTTAARSAQALGGPVTGAFLAAGGPWLTAPFLFAGSVKIAYDLAVYRRFREIRPPEEDRGAPT